MAKQCYHQNVLYVVTKKVNIYERTRSKSNIKSLKTILSKIPLLVDLLF